jgi:hypothetical protein
MVYSNLPERIATVVLVGGDEDIVIDGSKVISISPSRKGGAIFVPQNIEEALLEMARALPRWYQAALRRSDGDYECLVSLNQLELSVVVMNWFWVNWEMEIQTSKLRRYFEQQGVQNRDQIIMVLHDAFCHYLKFGIERAKEVIGKSSDKGNL